ncbi:MAG: RNA polymerase sigma factor [Bacteroidota bacterium]
MAVIKLHESLLQSLIQGCIQLERDSQKKFYTNFYGYALTVCHRYIQTEDEAIEVMHDGFLKIFKDLHKFEARHNNLEASLKGWMRRIFINTAVDHLRKQKHRFEINVSLDFDSPEVNSGDWPADRFSHKELLEMISKLSPAYRMVFNLYVIDGYTHEEIGQMLNISTGTSKSNLSKARVNLQKMILQSKEHRIDYERKAI